MSSQKDDDSIQRRELRKRLISDITSLRTRGLGKPKAGDHSDLLKIAVLFAPTMPTDAERVEALIETAITKKYGGTLLAHVARLAFGADLTVRGKGHKERYKAAWKAYDTGTYSSFTTAMLPKIGDDLAAQVTDIFDEGNDRGWDVVTYEPPPTEVEDEPPSTPEPDEASISPPAASSKFWRRLRPSWAVALLLSIGTAGALVIAFTFPSGKNPGNGAMPKPPSLPKEGTVINARSGKPVFHPDKQPPGHSDRPRIGRLTFCDLSDPSKECEEGWAPRAIAYTKAKPFVAKIGDVIEARFPLWATGTAPIPFLRLGLSGGGGGELTSTEIHINNVVSWLNPEGGTASYVPGYKSNRESIGGKNGQVIKGNGAMSLPEYVDGSTRLWESWGDRRIAMLPDGIDEGDLYLTNLGAPENCLCSKRPYVREVSFRFKLAVYRKG
jgi:hypothetical protein